MSCNQIHKLPVLQRQSKAFERSVNIAPYAPPLSRDFLHFSIITRRQCCALKPFRNSHWEFESMFSKYLLIWIYINFSNNFERFGKNTDIGL